MKANYSNSVILNNAAVNTYVHLIKDVRALEWDIDEFLKLKFQFIMDNLCIDRYLIGGTAALIMCYDIPIRKQMRDIDVIVPAGTIAKIRELVENSPFYKVVNKYSDYLYGDDRNTHIEIKCIEGFAIDLVETKEEDFDNMYYSAPMVRDINYCPLINILETKNKWRRPKDLDDLFFIEKWFEALGIEQIEERKQRDVSDEIAIEEMKAEEKFKEQMEALYKLREKMDC